jgi:acyl-CoA thioesterase II
MREKEDVLAELLDLLELETIEYGIYRGKSQDLGFGSLFGGQVIGQALSAARETVEDDRNVHSFHSYFLLPGDASKPIVYDVEVIRDGRSFSSRRVKAIQHGRPIFFVMASFQLSQPGLEHAETMPEVPGPEELRSEVELARAYAARIPASIREQFVCDKPIEMRPVIPVNPFNPKPMPPQRNVWFRANGDMPDDAQVHRYLLAYASDFNCLTTALQPHGRSLIQPEVVMATIDHAMWFHRPFRFDEWLLYAVDSPSASGSRGLVRGRFFDRDGRLVASTVQEGLIRVRGVTA